MAHTTDCLYKHEFWAEENLRYVKPHFRLAKAAWIVDRIARRQRRDLLDVGCGPATLERLLDPGISYHGLDIAIQRPAENLRQMDFLAEPIRFDGQHFDIVVAQGVFEYVGRFQHEKFAEIKSILRPNGVFLVSYVNFDHIHRRVYEPYSNVQSFTEFRASLQRVFRVERFFPTSYHWYHREPNRAWLQTLQMHITLTIPVLSRFFAVEYFFLCS